MSSFGASLRSLRRSAGLTIEQLAAASGVSGRAISDMERGHSRAPQARTLTALAGGLGLDAAKLRELEDAAEEQRSRGVSDRPRVCELPRAVSDFVGRAAEIRIFRDFVGFEAERPAPVAVVHGQAGLGKTAFALRLAGDLKDRFPDGQFYLDLRGTDEAPMEVGEALVRLLRALEVSPRRIAETNEERSSQLRAALTSRRCLLVLDNAGNEAQVRPLLPGDGASVAVVTSRRVLGGLEGVLRLPLAPLAPAESAELLGAIAAQAVGPEVDQVSLLCGHLPLALRIAGTRLATRPSWTVGHLLTRLADADRRLAALSVGDAGVATAFALSHTQLSAPARALFRRLAHVPGVCFSPEIAAVLAGIGPDEAVDGLEELVELGMLMPEPDGWIRYRFHDLIRLYAAQRLNTEEPSGVRAETRSRLTTWLLETAIVAGRWFEPGYGSRPDDYDGLVPLADEAEAGEWLRSEADNWLGALRWAAEAGRHQLVVDVAEAMHWFSDSMVFWAGWYEVYGLSQTAAAQLPDRHQEVTHLNYFAWAATHAARRPEEGADIAMRGYDLAVEIGDVKEQAWALTYAGTASRFAGQLERALPLYQRAQKLASDVGDHDAYIQHFQGLGLLFAAMGREEEALEMFASTIREAAIRPVSPRPAMSAQAGAHTFAGEVLAGLGRWEEALREAELALPMVQQTGDNSLTGQVHLTLGRARSALGSPDAARTSLTLALELLEEAHFEKGIALARAQLAALTSA
ncbi:transcriptional regulator with XRE-family HTH domain/tetratricopeptide (TPR) repeat protein [Actinoplanes lutulentus]|uniref:Tetratricopeptide repeat protein n=1 Tax=Actinoplanes lutulentus TaxID=1287878 RepID=A0A327ZNH6_9ACTN|nr:tetratricopeptide repeat protein [Actinoplanes lutulentus]MBB2943983.1 transcriptional regulator with XRE-family HTH domain/tetratricopeptide (TPR) repeat protein [Actinoplanes lutulentus]RAK42784.1 tetratricopeptide repeat protein [Actinoplanes lutulentus]